MGSRLQPAGSSLTSSRCITTSAAAAAAAAASDRADWFRQSADLQQLQERVQQALQDTPSSSSSRRSSKRKSSGGSLSAADAAAAYSAASSLAGKQPAAAAPVLQLLAPAWAAALPAASIKDVGDVLVSWSNLQYTDAQLWGSTLKALPRLRESGNG
uniref:Uncharacterized protein n=1 Tax=Tetradesmus obliquus TaxID=3088 RepID=A0A383WEZ2_TETOB|eukprot:jgi/Sobl393_1/1892/SZX75306.1